MAHLDKRRRGVLLRAILGILADHPNGIQAKDALAEVEQRVEPTAVEREQQPAGEGRVFDQELGLLAADAVTVGWMQIEGQSWSPTADGLAAHGQLPDPTELIEEVDRLYKSAATRGAARPEASPDPGREITGSSQILLGPRQRSPDELRGAVREMDLADLQGLVVALLGGMGYHVASVSAISKDRGGEILAYLTPFGTEGPALRAHVATGETRTDVKDVRAFLELLHEQSVGLMVNTAGFTPGAQEAVRDEVRRLTLLDPGDLVDLWASHFEQMSLTDRHRLPLREVTVETVSDGT